MKPDGRPPERAEALLRLALGRSDEARSVLGDLHEDYAHRLRTRGRAQARHWYWRESISLVVSALVGRVLGRPLTRDDREGDVEMGDGWSTSGFAQDLVYALRAIRRDGGFFAIATLIIGLGVGASTAVFSVMSPLLLRPLPFEEPERLVLVENEGGGGLSSVTSRTSNVRDFRELARSFEAIAGFNAFFDQQSFNLTGVGEPERLVGANVTDDLIDVLGVKMAAGRDFTPDEGVQDGPSAMVLTHGFWVRRFAGDPSVIGTTLPLNDQPYTVVGVLPPSFDFSSVFAPTVPVDFLLPWPISDRTDNSGNTTTMVARLRPGVSVEAAQAELKSIVAALEQREPDRRGLGARTSSLQARIARPFRSGLYLLAAAAGLVMLIVCVNLSNMLLARSPRRKREMAVRRTMGATRGRLVRQLLLESTAVSFTGAVVGLAVAYTVTRFVTTRQGLDIPMLASISIDGQALVFTAAVALLAGLAVGMVPALQVSEGGEAAALGGSARGSGGGRSARRLRELLVVAEVAMACVLLVFGGLVIQSFRHVMDVDLGFESTHRLGWQLATSRAFDTLPEIVAFYDEVVTNVAAVPGVEAVGLVDALPLGTNRSWSTRVVDKQYEDDEVDGFFPHVVDHRYLEAMGIPLVEGRSFDAGDDRDGRPVVMVSEQAARRMFDGDALGRRIRMWFGEPEVVGVVGDVKHRGLELQADNEIYFPMAQVWAFQTVEMVVRSSLPPESVAGPVGDAIRAVDPQMPSEDWRTLDSVVERSVSPRRFTLQILVAFALGALILASLGIYGVLSYSVTERIPEIGIRMALGESAASVRRGVVRRTLLLALAGIGIGALVSVVGSSLITALLYGVEPTDPLTFGATVAVLLGVALISGLIPAIRASRVDAAGALRSAT